MRRLLIISADYTGHGHKSIADSLTERLAAYKDLEVKIIDGFDLMSKGKKFIAEMTYGPVTRLPGRAWETSFKAGMKYKDQLKSVFAMAIKKRFEQLMLDFRPDCIMTVHPMFCGSILDLLEELKFDVPMIAHEADLIDIALQWFDPRMDLTLAPSQEAYDCTIANGMDPAKVIKVGFPVRSRFMGLADTRAITESDGLTITIMSGSEGSGVVRDIAKALLENTSAKLNVVCGRNKALCEKLSKTLGAEYPDRMNALGFVEKIQDVMVASDVLVMRASPNSVMEAIALNKPVILFGQLAGQELHNPDMLQAHGLAVYCPEPERLAACINELTKDGGAGVERMRECQRAYAPGDVAVETAKLISDYIKPLDWDKIIKERS